MSESARRIQHLCNIDMDAMAFDDVTYIDDYCSTWLVDEAPNQPIRSNGSSFDPWHPEIGYAKCSEAVSAWKQIMPLASAPVA